MHSTINATLQRDVEAALQEGLARYEISTGRTQFHGPEANIADAVQKLDADNHGGAPAGMPTAMPVWQQALQAMHLPLYDVHWTPAVVLQKGDSKKGDNAIRVGLPDGRIVPLKAWGGEIRRSLGVYDVVYVRVIETKGSDAKANDAKGNDAKGATGKARAKVSAPVAPSVLAELRVRPTVQGAALVLENKTGRILAMTGGFSYPLSQLNRTSQTQRQPGSAIKPLTYLTALQKGLQPNTLVLDDPITFPPIGTGGSGAYSRDIIAREFNGSAREEDYWTPRNYGYYSGGMYTLRRGLENSVNIVTAHLLDGGIDADPEKSLEDVCATAVAAKIYTDCIRYYPFVLGAQPVRMIDLAAFYAAVANEGARAQPHAIDSIEKHGATVYQYPNTPPAWIGAADRTSFYQLKTMLQGVVERGTARAISSLSPYVAGKTGTTEDSIDGWFIGFTNDVTVAIWVGYDNGDGKRRSLGDDATGGRVALPIFEPIIDAIWSEQIAPKTPLSGPSPEAQRHLIDLPIDLVSGDRVSSKRGGFVEHFRLNADGRFSETQYQLVSHEDAYASREEEQGDDSNQGFGTWGWGGRAGRSYYPAQGWQQGQQGQQGQQRWEWSWQHGWQPVPPPPPPPPPPQHPPPVARGLFAPRTDPDDPRNRARRDPDYFWGGRFN